MESTKSHDKTSNFHTEMLSKQQLDLFESLPHKPYCMDDKPSYMLIRSKAIAVKKPYIQVNPPLTTIYFVFDDDKGDAALSWFDANLPQPLWTTQNPLNGRCHHCYKLESHFLQVSLRASKRLSMHRQFITLMLWSSVLTLRIRNSSPRTHCILNGVLPSGLIELTLLIT